MFTSKHLLGLSFAPLVFTLLVTLALVGCGNSNALVLNSSNGNNLTSKNSITTTASNDGLTFTRYTQQIAQDITSVNPGLDAQYIPTLLLPNDSFEGAIKAGKDTLCIYYDNEVLLEGKTPTLFYGDKTSKVKLKNGCLATWIVQKHGGKIQFKLYHTYVLLESSKLTQMQLMDVAGSVTPVNG